MKDSGWDAATTCSWARMREAERAAALYGLVESGEDKLDLDDKDEPADTDNSLKTINSQRVLPIHSQLGVPLISVQKVTVPIASSGAALVL